jgi:hypothetical protein
MTVKHATIRQHPSPSRDVSIFTSAHKGSEKVVLSQPTPNGRQIVEVEVDRHNLGELIEALQSLQSFLSPHSYTPRGEGPAGSLEI